MFGIRSWISEFRASSFDAELRYELRQRQTIDEAVKERLFIEARFSALEVGFLNPEPPASMPNFDTSFENDKRETSFY
jgi:hypothetical protein